MDKAHDVQNASISGQFLYLLIDGKDYKINIVEISSRLARATPKQKENFEVSPAGYGIHWPDIDEDLSIDGLIGVKHTFPVAELRQYL